MTTTKFERNPIVQVGKAKLKILGDVHLGREFKEFVPLARRGEREASVWDQFQDEFEDLVNVDALIQIGDLFEKFTVPNKLVLDTAEVLTMAPLRYGQKPILILRGNHDASRDSSIASSFEVLEKIVSSDSVRFVQEPIIIKIAGEAIGLVPWDPFKSAEELVAELDTCKCSAVFGHWDIENFGKPNPNLIPLEKLSAITKQVFTGHIHSPKEFSYNGTKINVVGSMQPYSFAEDPTGEFYVTMPREEAEQIYAQDKSFFKNKNLRLLLKPNEEMPDIDCLQLRPKKIEGEKLDAKVEFEQFDFRTLFDDVFKDVDLAIKDEVWTKYTELKESLDL